MATTESLRLRHEAVLAQFEDKKEVVKEVQGQALDQLLPSLQSELQLSEQNVINIRAFLEDTVTAFRFCRRGRFVPENVLQLLHDTLVWRMTSSIAALSTANCSPAYVNEPLFFFHPDLVDKFGRPCGVINLKYVKRDEDGELTDIKEYIKLMWETSRRWLSDSSKKTGKPALQMVVIVNLAGASMSNLEIELLPFFMDLLKCHFPGMIGAIFVLNYGWMYAGMWQLAKRVLPKTALDRILFPSKEDLLQFFDEQHLLAEHGGTIQYTYSKANSILRKYAGPESAQFEAAAAYPSPAPSPMISRSPSYHSLSADVFHSAPSSRPMTPRIPAGLSMTPSHHHLPTFDSEPHSRDSTNTSASSVRRVPSLADLQRRLLETQRAIESSESDDETETPALGSAFSSRAPSRDASRATSREPSPKRKSNWVSPYHSSNPYYGYPAIAPTGAAVPQPHHHRRRKRDLVRTLTYLALLRFLSFHRAMRARLGALIAFVIRFTGVRYVLSRVGGTRRIPWTSSNGMMSRLPYALLLLTLARTPLVSSTVEKPALGLRNGGQRLLEWVVASTR